MPPRYFLIPCLVLALAGCGEAIPGGTPARRTGSGLGGAETLFLGLLVLGVGLLVWFLRRRRTPPVDYSDPVTLSQPTSPTRRVSREPNASLRVEIRREEKRVPVAVEVVKVPSGVSISVKRTRTVEHAVEIQSGHKLHAHAETELLGLLRTSVRGEIERRLGRTYKESSSTEYEVKLNGESARAYRLVWIDVWIEGEAHTKGQEAVAFQFRDRAELEVVPVE